MALPTFYVTATPGCSNGVPLLPLGPVCPPPLQLDLLKLLLGERRSITVVGDVSISLLLLHASCIMHA